MHDIRLPAVRVAALAGGLVTLALVWLGPLPARASHTFSAHMLMHMAVVAIAAPLVACGIAGSRFDPVRVVPALFAPIPASIVELAIVWGWHAPVLHHAARVNGSVFGLEQATFLGAGLLLWLSAVGGFENQTFPHWRAAAGVGALLFTSIHMTLLGALFALAPRVLYAHAGVPPHATAWMSPLADQHLGGAIMLLVGGASYMVGSLWLLAGVLRTRAAAA